MTIDITPEAVERIASNSTMTPPYVVATLRALSAALTASQAETAAAYEAAASVLDKWAANLRDKNFPDTAPIVEQCSAMIRALPTTFTNAELLAAAMQLPEVRALVEALRWHAGDTSSQGDKARAALAPFMKGGE